MVNRALLREDLKKFSIEEVCEKHGLSFREVVKVMEENQPRKPKKRKMDYHSTGERYISYYNKRYMLRRRMNGKFRSFGGYMTLDDAIRMRDYLDENGWYSHRVPSIRKKLGI